jgi:hypothetical protein
MRSALLQRPPRGLYWERSNDKHNIMHSDITIPPPYVPQTGQLFYFVDMYGEVRTARYDDSPTHRLLVTCGNVFSDFTYSQLVASVLKELYVRVETKMER